MTIRSNRSAYTGTRSKLRRSCPRRFVRAFAYWREPDPSAALPDLGKALGAAAARAHDAGVTLALENEHECNVATSGEARAALDATNSPYLRLIWDPGNAAMLDPAHSTGLAAWRRSTTASRMCT